MKLYKKLFSYWMGVALLATIGLSACQPEIDEPTLTSGSADFSTYVALGNSLTSGYADGALYREGQINSYPAMLAMSMDKVGGIDGEFKTPLVPEGNGSGGANGRLVLTPESFPFPVPTANDPSIFASVASQGPYQNLGVPGAKSFHLVAPGYGSAQGNPFFARFATAPTTTVVADAAAQNPTFFTLWIGNNDVLGYALAGGDQGTEPITPTATFQEAMNGIVATLEGAKGGAIANVPDILSIPYFTTVAYNAFPLSAQQATALNAGLRAQTEAGARPQITQVVTDTVRARTRVGVTEFVRENQVRPGVVAVVTDTVKARVTRGVIAQITPTVTAGLRQQIIVDSLAAGSTQAAAEAAADSFIASPTGRATIQAGVDQQVQSPQVQGQIQAIVAQQLESDAVKAEIEANINQQMLSPQVQAGIEAEVNRRLALPETSDLIEQNVQQQLDAILSNLPSVAEGNNPFVIQGQRTATNPTGLRSANENDLILLPASSYLGAEAAAGRPPLLPERLVLDASEKAKITNAIAEYNSIIQAIAGSKYAYVDMNSFFNQVKGGYLNQGVNYDARFVLGGAFSLDGVHLTQRGYALAANEFIKTINSKYNSKLPWVDVNSYKGITFP